MKILTKMEFRHGTTNLKSGKQYEVPDALGVYFVGNGWAVDAANPDAEPVGPDMDAKILEVKSMKHKQKTKTR